MKKIKNVLSIAGSDSSGGAGIQADLKAFHSQGVYGASVITAITAQNTQKITHTYPLDSQTVLHQLNTTCEDIHFDAIKIGMLSEKTLIEKLSRILSNISKNIIIDPVMVATSGDRLINENAIDALKNLIKNSALIFTPNLDEALILADSKKMPTNLTQMINLSKELYRIYDTCVLLKGGHLDGEHLFEVLFDGQDYLMIGNQKIKNRTSFHGSGCTLSSALAANIAQGYHLRKSTEIAVQYVQDAIKSSICLEVGKGASPLNHLFSIIKN